MGKAALLRELIEIINTSIGGFISHIQAAKNTEMLNIVSLYDGIEQYSIADVLSNSPCRYSETLRQTFDNSAVSILKKSMESRDIIIIDRLGAMVADCHNFQSEVSRLLDSNKIMLGIITDESCNFLNSIRNRSDVKLVYVTQENKGTLLNELINTLKGYGCPIKEGHYFQWDNKRINWYNQALSYSGCSYPDVFLEEIGEHAGSLRDKSILDIGAGTGAFAIPLAKDGAYITALDSSFNMLNSLKKNADSEGIRTISYLLSPFEDAKTSQHDIAVSAFSGIGKTKHDILKIISLTKEYVFLISQIKYTHENFKADILSKKLGKPERRYDKKASDTIAILNDIGCSYEYKEFEYSFPQYFMSFEESVDFMKSHFRLHSEAEIEAAKELLNENLIKLDKGFLFPNDRKSSFITIKLK